MKNHANKPAERWGLLATGSSGCWSVDLDEALDRNEWTLTIEGPQSYLVFQLQELKVIAKVVHFLQSRTFSKSSVRQDEFKEVELCVGRFGSAGVSLLRDNEDFPRYFLVIGPQGQSTMRMTIEGSDIAMLCEALQEVLAEVPQPNSD